MPLYPQRGLPDLARSTSDTRRGLQLHILTAGGALIATATASDVRAAFPYRPSLCGTVPGPLLIQCAVFNLIAGGALIATAMVSNVRAAFSYHRSRLCLLLLFVFE